MTALETRFRDRETAGAVLAERLRAHGFERPVILGLPRGGVVVAAEVARALQAPLDIVLVRKVGFPGHEEFAVGAVAEGGHAYFDKNTFRHFDLGWEAIEPTLDRERAELERRVARYRTALPLQDLTGATAILVDDGIATGATMKAAALSVRARGARAVIAAAPVAAREAVATVEEAVEEMVVGYVPEEFIAVGQFYEDFEQVEDDAVLRLLAAFQEPN